MAEVKLAGTKKGEAWGPLYVCACNGACAAACKASGVTCNPALAMPPPAGPCGDCILDAANGCRAEYMTCSNN